MKLIAILITSLVLALPAARAHEAKLGAMTIEHPYAPSTPAAARTGIVYTTIVNRGEADRIVAARTSAAEKVELHTTIRDGDTMRMRAVEAIPVAMGGTLALQPGQRFHLMLVNLVKPLREGDSFTLSVTFEKAGTIDLTIPVERLKTGGNHHP